MSFRDFVEESRGMILSTFEALGLSIPSSLEWSEPPNKNFGDLSFRIGFMIGRSLRKGPGQVASNVAKYATEHYVQNSKYVESVEGHPAGFLNFKLKKKDFFSDVLASSRTVDYGKIDLGRQKTVLIEHTAVNPNKALHVGHLRNVALGDCLARLLRFTSFDTFVLNYIDDSGLQVADVIVGLLHLGFAEEAPEGQKYDHYTGDTIYVSVTKKYDEDPSLKEKQRKVLKAIEDHEPEIFPLASRVIEKILGEQLKTCWRFGAFYDLLVYESDIIAAGLWASIFEDLKKKEIARLVTEGKLEGCWIVSVEGEAEGEDKVLVRSDGTATYIAKDIPLAALKTGLISDSFSYDKYLVQPNNAQLFRTRSSEGAIKLSPIPWGADRTLTVIGSEQSRLQRIIRRILEQLSETDLSEKYVHVGYAIISLSPKTAQSLTRISGQGQGETQRVVTMSGRKGTYIKADDAINLVKAKALLETKKRNPESNDADWADRVAEKIAISALRFSLLKQDLDKMLVFDLDEALRLVGETGPYMLYTYARASSIISKLGNQAAGDIQGDSLKSESETELLKVVSKFDIALEKAVKMLAPKWIAHYSFELCETFNKFYELNRVIQEQDEAIRNARIALVLGTMNVLKRSLDILGIEVLEKI
ncbi:MAG TPA: arginine--tRNA ligase [Nitrososphaerales archaeon]|nr:arginine--tRNA ligase [Nitrososphaerales archaeon]